MDLHVTVVNAPPSTRPACEIVVDTEALPTGALLAERLEAAGWNRPLTVDGVPLSAFRHPESLRDGAVIVAGAPEAPQRPQPVPHLALVVHSGPDAGQVFPLSRGIHTIGRADADIVIADPALSRAHARLSVTEDAIVLDDVDSANGTFLDGEPVRHEAVTVASHLRFGASTCRLTLMDRPAWVGPTPGDLLDPVPVGPDQPKKPSRVLVLTALLPLVVGVVLALTTGMWFFLAFSALSAVTGTVPLLTHRRAARAFAHAVQEAADRDRRRRLSAVPDPGHTGIDALRAVRLPDGDHVHAVSRPMVVLLRIGTANQPANVVVRRTEGHFEAPLLEKVPLLIACSASPASGTDPGLTISGQTGAVLDLVRALLLQLAHPRTASPTVVCWGTADDVPHHARFLPPVHVTRDPRKLESLLEQGPCLVLHFSDELPPAAAACFVIRVLPDDDSLQEGQTRTTASGAVVLTTGAGRALIGGSLLELEPDAVSARTFARTARLLASGGANRRPQRERGPSGSPTPMESATPPSSASLWSSDAMPSGLAGKVLASWPTSDPQRPVARLGASRHGPVFADLVKDGPHLLVAGTTGSGKSEFLRTLVLGLAMSQPPEHLTLLLVDYKGGSGLGELSALPHCVGSMSDLSSESTARAFVSLRAELRRREALCATNGARDLDQLRQLSPSTCPPRLVVVIDEFRALLDDVPSVSPDLLKIASLGRSLGVHLVLATQKAQGAVSPDLRANLTSTVLLRVRTAIESQDLLGTASAAEIPVDLPGRAYLRRGNEPPIEFQVAAASSPPTAERSPGWQDFRSFVEGATPAPDPDDPADDPPALVAEAAQALRAAALAFGQRFPERPVLGDLPDRLDAADCSALLPADPGPFLPGHRGTPGRVANAERGVGGVALGVADLPEHQAQRCLRWRPRDHSHLALVGLPGSGGSEAFGVLVEGLPLDDPDVHLYLLDGDGSLADLQDGRPGGTRIGRHTGALVRPHETRRAARVLERLADLPASRTREQHIVLAITGWGRWITQFRGIRNGRTEDDLLAIVRDGSLSGVTVLVLGDRELTSSRFFSLIPNRVYLPLGAHQETTLTWPRMPLMDGVAGRAFAQGRITGAWGDAVCQVLMQPTAAPVSRSPAHRPFRVEPLPATVMLSEIQEIQEIQEIDAIPAGASPDPAREASVVPVTSGIHVPDNAADSPVPLPIGVCGDELQPFRVTLRAGDVFLVLGQPASGRTNVVRVLEAVLSVATRRYEVLTPPSGAGASRTEDYWRSLQASCTSPTRLPRSILLVDDADRLPADVQRILTELVAGGARAVLSARPGPALMSRVPLTLQARSSGSGLVLSPTSPNDGDLFGVRLDVGGAAHPGRGFAVDPGGVREVQIACAPPSPSPGPPTVRIPLRDAAGERATAFVRRL